jgi:hypothetical protein
MEYKITYKFERLSEIFKFVWSECISLKNTHLILEFSFLIPSISAAIESAYSITNVLWTDRKSRFLLETINRVIVTQTYFEEISCNDLYISRLWFKTIPNYFKQFFHLRRTRHLPKKKNDSFNVNWKLTSNKILYLLLKKLIKIWN